MKITPIFTKNRESRLWAVCIKKGGKKGKCTDVFTELINQFTNTEYLLNFFIPHKEELDRPFWKGIGVDGAVEKVRQEITHLAKELYSIDNNLPGYENSSLSDVFIALHSNIYSLNFNNERFRKAKPDFDKPMVRLYAIELEDGTFIITGGTIKLIIDMRGEMFDHEIKKLNKLRDFLKEEKINDLEGLKDLLNEE